MLTTNYSRQLCRDVLPFSGCSRIECVGEGACLMSAKVVRYEVLSRDTLSYVSVVLLEMRNYALLRPPMLELIGEEKDDSSLVNVPITP